AYLPPGTPWRIPLPVAAGIVALRVEGPAPSVAYRRQALLREHASNGETAELGEADTASLWRDVGDVAPLAGFTDRAIWRVSVAPTRGAVIAEIVADALDTTWFL